jgi:colanic acid biosynthesis protein WcaH
MTLTETITSLEQQIADPTVGLPEDIFLFASRITPMVNVDLLVRDNAGRTLLAWRNDAFSGKGWHIPGGIIRFRETFAQRILKVAITELGTPVEFDPTPIALHQIILPEQKSRSHFISLLYSCSLPDGFAPANTGLTPTTTGFLQWHTHCPDNLLPVHEIYRTYIEQGAHPS